MSKKIFHSTPKRMLSLPQKVMVVDPVSRRHEKSTREYADGETRRGTNRRKARQAVKQEARYNRETSRDQRRQAKLPVTSIGFEVGDLVYHIRDEDTFMLVTGISKFARHTYVECMVGTNVIEHKALHLRKAEED